MRNRSLLSHYSLKSYSVCPDCQARYTTDAGTRKRGLIIAFLALLTMIISTAGFLAGFPRGLAAFLAGIGLLGYVGYALSKIKYVEYRD